MNKYLMLSICFVVLGFIFYQTNHLFYVLIGFSFVFFSIYRFIIDKKYPPTPENFRMNMRVYVGKYILFIGGIFAIIISIYDMIKYKNL